MKVLLRKNVTEKGKKGEFIEISDNYANNFLLPLGLVYAEPNTRYLERNIGAEFKIKSSLHRLTDVKFICNPYTIKSEVFINGEKWEDFPYKNERLQFWVPKKVFSELKNKTGDNDLHIRFFGTILDYEDLELFLKEIDDTNIILEHTEIGESSETKIFFLKLLFEEMQRFSPFQANPSIKQEIDEIKNKFTNIMNSSVEIAVIATMSSGKSTLINAMMHNNLLPSGNKATTATIMRLKNNDELTDQDWLVGWYDKKGKLSGYAPLTTELINKLNEDKQVRDIYVEGNFPYLKSKYFPLIIVDTPGPNNSQTIEHKEHTYKIINSDEKIKPIILYVLNATQLEIEDDNKLLDDIAKKINEPGKNSKYRFIFVINKMDMFDFDKGEKTEDTLKSVTEYLKKRGIEKPNIYPVSAEMCKVLRMSENGIALTI